MSLSSLHATQVGRPLLPLALALFSTVVAAQAPAASAPTPGVSVLPATLQYQSPLTNYRRYDDQAVQPWREANDRVGQIGGWRTYAKEAAAQPSTGQAPAQDAHSGHHGGASK